MARKGKRCSVSTRRMISPTAPVAPTTATLGTTPDLLCEAELRIRLAATRSLRSGARCIHALRSEDSASRLTVDCTGFVARGVAACGLAFAVPGIGAVAARRQLLDG